MKTTKDFLTEAVYRCLPQTKYRLAKTLQIETSQLARYFRTGRTMDDRMALKVAELLGEKPEYVLACVHAERAALPEVKRVAKPRALPLELVTLHRNWRGWTLCPDGLLYFDGWKKGFAPGELAGMPYREALIKAHERNIARLEAELARRVADCETAENLAAFYRRQVVAQAQLGFLLGLLGD